MFVRQSLILALVIAMGCLSIRADDTGTVSMVGKNIDSSDSKTFGLLLVLADKTWREFEAGNATHFFKAREANTFTWGLPTRSSCARKALFLAVRRLPTLKLDS